MAFALIESSFAFVVGFTNPAIVTTIFSYILWEKTTAVGVSIHFCFFCLRLSFCHDLPDKLWRVLFGRSFTMMTKRRGLITLSCSVPILMNLFYDLQFPGFTLNDLSVRKSRIHHSVVPLMPS